MPLIHHHHHPGIRWYADAIILTFDEADEERVNIGASAAAQGHGMIITRRRGRRTTGAEELQWVFTR